MLNGWLISIEIYVFTPSKFYDIVNDSSQVSRILRQMDQH